MGEAPYEIFVTEFLDVILISKVTPPRAINWNSPFEYGFSHDIKFPLFYRLDDALLARLRTLGGNFSPEKAQQFKQVLDTFRNQS